MGVPLPLSDTDFISFEKQRGNEMAVGKNTSFISTEWTHFGNQTYIVALELVRAHYMEFSKSQSKVSSAHMTCEVGYAN